MSEQLLPTEFADLERFAEKWCLATEDERYDERLATVFEEIQDFYDAVMARAEDAIKYCDAYTLDELPEEVKNLVLLICSLVEVSFAVECWGQVRVPDTGAAKVDCILQPLL